MVIFDYNYNLDIFALAAVFYAVATNRRAGRCVVPKGVAGSASDGGVQMFAATRHGN
jgi:hypothetical protein